MDYHNILQNLSILENSAFTFLS